MTWAGAFLLMILVAFGWRSVNSIGPAGNIVPGVAVTATQTEAPTLTMTQTVEAYNGGQDTNRFSFVSTRVSTESNSSQAPIAFPAATPIAALAFGTP